MSLDVLMQTYNFQRCDFRQMSYTAGFLVGPERVGTTDNTALVESLQNALGHYFFGARVLIVAK